MGAKNHSQKGDFLFAAMGRGGKRRRPYLHWLKFLTTHLPHGFANPIGLGLGARWICLWGALAFTGYLLGASPALSDDLAGIRQRGVLRHIGVPYAHFVRQTDKGLDGLDVELMRQFAQHLGVRYQWVESSWANVIGDLTGQQVMPKADGNVKILGPTPVRGDIIANGLTILPWREKVIDYSTPTFPTSVWLMARADSPLKPIEPSGHTPTDIKRVKALLAGRSVLTMKGTCLDPRLYDLAAAQADIRYFSNSDNLNDIAPAVMKGVAEATLLDIPNALVSLQRWPGEIKIIGPISEPQFMGAAVAKSSKGLLDEFNRFFKDFCSSGAYGELVRKYYPAIFLYLGDFFE